MAQIEKKTFNGGLDLDSQPEFVSQGDYVDATNIEIRNGGVINLSGNKLVPFTLPTTVFNARLVDTITTFKRKVIGSYEDITRGFIYYFVNTWEEPSPDFIPTNLLGFLFQYNKFTGVNRLVTALESDVVTLDGALNPADGVIHSIDIINRPDVDGDLLLFLGVNGVPREINIKKALSPSERVNFYGANDATAIPSSRISLAKAPPLKPPTALYNKDSQRKENNLLGKLFQFQYRYVYHDGAKSTWSPASKVPVPTQYLDPATYSDPTRENVINVEFDKGDLSVSEIEIGAKFAENSIFGDLNLIETITRPSTGSQIISFLFYNDGVYTPLPISESNLLFDYVPKKANCQGLINGNVISYAGITEGYNRETVDLSTIVQPFTPIGASDPLPTISSSPSFEISLGPPTVQVRQGTRLDITVNGRDTVSASNNAFLTSTIINPNQIRFTVNPPTGVIPTGTLFTIRLTGYNGNDFSPPQYFDVTHSYLSQAGNAANDVAIALHTLLFTSDYSGANLSGNQFDAVASGNNYFESVDVSPTNTSGGDITYWSEPFSYTTISGDTAASATTALFNLINTSSRISASSTSATSFQLNTIIPSVGTRQIDSVVTNVFNASSSLVGGVNDSTRRWKFSGRYKLGVVYFDEQGRTNGVTGVGDISIPFYQEISGDPSIFEVQTNIGTAAPTWAKTYQLVRSEELSADKFLYWATSGGMNGVKVDAGFTYFKIDNLSTFAGNLNFNAPIINYSFTQGDRIRLLKNITSTTILTENDFEVVGDILNPILSSGPPLSGRYIKVRGTLSGVVDSTDIYLIELYTPARRTQEGLTLFYEFGEQYGIVSRAHQANKQNQILTGTTQPAQVISVEGDVYLRSRNMISTTHKVLDVNFSDYFVSNVNSNGRPHIIDEDERERFLGAVVRYSQEIFTDTSNNGLNRFFFDSQEEADRTFGAIKRMRQRDRQLRIFQERKCGLFPVLQSLITDAGAAGFLGQSDKLLNNVQYYAGEYGIGDAVKSLVSEGFADYFIDPIKGVILRLSLDGLTPLSIIYKIDTWARENIANSSKAIAGYDRARNSYIIYCTNRRNERVNIVFNESLNKFTTKLSFEPDDLVASHDDLITFKDGKLWLHPNPYNDRNLTSGQTPYCNFYGVQDSASVTGVFNGGTNLKKTFLGTSSVGRGLWYLSKIETSTSQLSSLIPNDYKVIEGVNILSDNFEGVFHTNLLKASGTVAAPTSGDLLDGEDLKGHWSKATFTIETPEKEVPLQLVEMKFIQSPINR